MSENQELYLKKMHGKQVRYVPYDPQITDMELTEAQILTLAGSLGIVVLSQYHKLVPSHRRNARKIKAVENALLDMLQGSGQDLDDSMADYAIACWNKAAMLMSIGAKEV